MPVLKRELDREQEGDDAKWHGDDGCVGREAEQAEKGGRHGTLEELSNTGSTGKGQWAGKIGKAWGERNLEDQQCGKGRVAGQGIALRFKVNMDGSQEGAPTLGEDPARRDNLEGRTC